MNAVYGEIPGGRRNNGSWNISEPPEMEEAAEAVVPVPTDVGVTCVDVLRLHEVPMRLGMLSAAIFCCCSMMASICFCMESSCSLLEGNCL